MKPEILLEYSVRAVGYFAGLLGYSVRGLGYTRDGCVFRDVAWGGSDSLTEDVFVDGYHTMSHAIWGGRGRGGEEEMESEGAAYRSYPSTLLSRSSTYYAFALV